ncbi:voltage-gated hydrogen channel 1-like isoform X1 [Myxocyprinus asiaticus]|uniref:voltage-gated hydrogen channel 1-like isoform X1 n=1 Tax=Myxocyprinus asiaticus TaxID=70543 RepID=UPI002223B1F1|nr:voltage-gated hydrogen channel 1-like isoform X1 [Myxocyprinus asiaticus]
MAMVFPDGSGLFQQDNSPHHTAHIDQEWFEEHDEEFKVLPWPPNSPDLNPIEHMWDVLDQQVQSMEAPPHKLQDLKDLLLMSWCQIPQDTFRGLVESMPRRVGTVLAAHGGPIAYYTGGHNVLAHQCIQTRGPFYAFSNVYISENNFEFCSFVDKIVVVSLVILDAIFVLCELLIDLSIIEADHHRIAPQVFHYLSLALLTFFMVELSGKIYAYRLEFFRHKFEVFDGIVVVVSFILDIVYISKEDAFDAMGLLILLRLWRVARIINGIIVSVKNRAHHKVQKVKEINEKLFHEVNGLKERNTKIDQENARLQALLKQHSIDY